MTHQEHYQIGRAKARRKRHMQLLSLAIQEEAAPELVESCLQRFNEGKAYVRNINARAHYIKSVCFNLNA